MNLAKLKDPFPATDVEWRIQQSGVKDGKVWAMCLAYITSRAVMDRLDEVCGPENWRNEYQAAPQGGVMCGLSIKMTDGWVTKWDGAENTDIEGVKGGLSGAMKRAAVQWGIGRYLYDLDAGWAQVREKGMYSAKTKDGTWFKWDPPLLPAWAQPNGHKPFANDEQRGVLRRYLKAFAAGVDMKDAKDIAAVTRASKLVEDNAVTGETIEKASSHLRQLVVKYFDSSAAEAIEQDAEMPTV